MASTQDFDSSNAPNLSQTVGDDDSADDVEEVELVNEGRPRKTASKAWLYFNKVFVDGLPKAKCKTCGKILERKYRNGTSTLKRHGQTSNPSAQSKISDVLKGNLKVTKKDDGTCTVEVSHFDHNVVRTLLGKMIIMHELPLSFVEYRGFRDFIEHVNPLVKPMSRNTLRSEILKMYQAEKVKSLRMLDNIHGRVAITTDMWTASNQNKGYTVVTNHFTDNSWHLHSRILRFIYVPSPHTAEALSHELVQCLLDWNVDRKLSAMTLDNCSTNDAMVEKLLVRFDTSTMISDGKFFHVRCIAHILNLIVREGMKVMESGVSKIRESVSYWVQTPKRVKTFELAARQLQIKSLNKLKLDCPTRWNSTYAMLATALMFRPVFSRVQQREPQYKSLPSEDEWDLAHTLVDHLKPFYMLTEMFSGTKYPTVNLFFPLTCKMKMSINGWRNSPNFAIRLMAQQMAEKFEKYWSTIHPVLVMAVVLDPRYKMLLVDFYYPKIYVERAQEQIEGAHKLCEELVKSYESKAKDFNGGEIGSSSVPLDLESDSRRLWEVDESETFLRSSKRVKVSKSEFEKYLEDESLEDTSGFDILTYWKMNKGNYPLLADIARDILAIPASTVASESAFSTGVRVLSPHHSKLRPDTLEALMCTQNWIWGSTSRVGGPQIFTAEETISEDDDDGPQASTSSSLA